MAEKTRRQFLRDMGTATLGIVALSGLSSFHGFASSETSESEDKNMDKQTMVESRSVAPDTESLISYSPIPGFGILPVNAFLIRGEQPILVDTGLAGVSDAFMQSLRSLIDLKDLRWLWLTHTDPDHVGSIRKILSEAYNARLITTFPGVGKLGILPVEVPMDRVYLLNPGQSLDVGDRRITAFKPPVYDAPETTGFFDTKTKVLFSADCFGAIMKEPANSVSDIAPSALRDSLLLWAAIDFPWVGMVDEAKFGKALDVVRKFDPKFILGSHLPPAAGMTETLLKHLAAARSAPPAMFPDQAALEQMLKAGAGK